ncbi:MAG: CHASE2 domain-containing protein [Phycisphaerae bacterium]
MTQAGESTPRLSRFIAVLLGAIATFTVAVTFTLGAWDRLELLALDERLTLVRHDPGSGHDPIAHVNIDDRSLQELGRWPWPRQVLADMVTTLDDAGAKVIALDIIFPEPQEVRLVDPAAEVYNAQAEEWLQQGPPRRVYDDLHLASAIADANAVLVPMHMDFSAAPPPADALAQTVDQLFEADQPPPPLPDVLAEIFENPLAAPPDALAGARREYLRRRSIRSLERFALDPHDVPPGELADGEMTPPLVLLANAADGTGFVTVESDSDRVVRRIRLVGRSGGKSWAQFALAVARQLRRVEGRPTTISLDSGYLTVAEDSTQLRLPVDDEQRMIIRWSKPDHHGVRISAAAVAAVGRERRKRRANEEAADVACWQLASMGRSFPDEQIKTLYWRCAELSEQLDTAHKQTLALQGQHLRRRLYHPASDDKSDELTDAQRREQQVQRRLRRSLRELATHLADESTRRTFLLGDPNASISEEQRRSLNRADELLSLIDRLERARAALDESIETMEGQFAKLVKGRVVLIGSTATGAADFVPTLRGPRTPGVEVHADILRTLLSGWSVRQAGPAWDLLAILAVGLTATTIASGCGAVRAAILTAVLLGVLVVGNVWAVFLQGGVVLALVAPAGAMTASYLVVTAYRQLTEERARRKVRRMFSHAVSPEVAEQLMRNPSMASVGGQRREITCLFSDLGGFTDLSRRIGSRATVWLLNRYFDGVTEVVQHEQGGYLNKFLGDGVLALFGAPLEQPDHAGRAVRAAMRCHEKLAELNRELTTQPDAPEATLQLRVGVAAGEAMVGNCGSSERMDYTAIGDCVNLASRLETACKFFDAKLLVERTAWRQANPADIPARPLGAVWITGVAQPIEVWQVLVGDEANPATAEPFAQGVAHLAAARYNQAAETFQRLAADAPTDQAATAFARLARALANGEPHHQLAGNGTVRIAYPGSNGFGA